MSEVIPVQGSVSAEVKADATPLVQATADVVSSSNKGAGKILNALFGKWIAKNDRSVALIQAQTEKDCLDIKNGFKVYRDNALRECPDPVKVVDAYDTLHTLNHMSDARRLQASIEEAMRQIAEVPSNVIADEPLSQTFFNRWRREAEMIDDDELRMWWAGLLKEEVVQPNCVSMRTLDVVKNLSKEDCNRFISLCRGVIRGELIVSYDNRPIFGSYEDVVGFQDLGLISNLQSEAKTEPGNGGTQITIWLHDNVSGLRITDGILCSHTFSLTRAGLDLLRVVGGSVMSNDDVKAICEFLTGHSLEACSIEVVDKCEVANEGAWKWIRGHRPACWE